MDPRTGEAFAVKRLSAMHHIECPYLVENEVYGLRRATKCETPRVVKLVEWFLAPDNDALLVLELVDGSGLNTFAKAYAAERMSSITSLQQHEQKVQEIAVQLMQTVHFLHLGSDLAHMDITSSNVMLRKEGFNSWDQLRLIDFGFAQGCCSSDYKVQDIVPHGATAAYAAPEVLHSLEVHYGEGSSGADTAFISGPSADWWSVGVVLYELLTGELPFSDHSVTSSNGMSANGASHSQAHSEHCEAVRQAQASWLEACESAKGTQCKVQHPLLDRAQIELQASSYSCLIPVLTCAPGQWIMSGVPAQAAECWRRWASTSRRLQQLQWQRPERHLERSRAAVQSGGVHPVCHAVRWPAPPWRLIVLWALVLPLAKLWVLVASNGRSANLQRQHMATLKLLSVALTAQRRLQATCCARLWRCSKSLL